MAISGSSVFGGNLLAAIPDGATAKSTALAANGVVLDVQESGVFGFASSDFSFDVSIEVDGREFSGGSPTIFALISAYNSSELYASNLPFYKSLKITISNYSSGSLSVSRISA